MRNKLFIKTICVLIGVIFLTMSVGKVSSVFALALPSNSVEPIYDTEIIELRNYVDTLPTPKLDTFHFLAGALVAAQAGTAQNRLVSPYTDPENVKEFLIGCGIGLYNSVIGFIENPNHFSNGINPGIDVGPILKGLTATLMGDAVVAANVDDLDTFLEDNNSFYFPIEPNIQQGLNFLFALDGGLYDWQFESSPFETTNFTWIYHDLSANFEQSFQAALSQMPYARYFWSPYDGSVYSNYIVSTPCRFKLFIDTDDHSIIPIQTATYTGDNFYYVLYNVNMNSILTGSLDRAFWQSLSYDPSQFQNYSQIVQYALNHYSSSSIFNTYVYASIFPRMSDLIDDYVAGPTLETAIPVENITDLNFQLNNIQYYEELQGEYLFDIIGLFNDLLNETDLHVPVFNNIYGTDLTPVTDPLYRLVNIALNLEQYLTETNPPVPVDLNSISEYTDNTYLEKVKEHARNFGDIFVNYIFFWHNCDAELVYVCFGAGILVLIAAFIGKWGHS